MAKIPNKFVLFGAVAVAALVVPGLGGPLMFDQAYAQASDREQSIHATQTATENLVNAQVALGVNANVEDVNVCVIVDDCD